MAKRVSFVSAAVLVGLCWAGCGKQSEQTTERPVLGGGGGTTDRESPGDVTPEPAAAPKEDVKSPAEPAPAVPPGEIRAVIETGKGTIRLRLFADKTPLTCANFVNLAKRGYYDGLTFHRVLPDFMIQGGCPQGTGRGGPGYRFEDEIVRELRHGKAGILSMANAGPRTNGSQFFITHKATPWLDGKHAVFGEVIDETDQAVVNEIVKGDRIERVTIEGDTAALIAKTKDRVAQWNGVLDQKFTHLRPAE